MLVQFKYNDITHTTNLLLKTLSLSLNTQSYRATFTFIFYILFTVLLDCLTHHPHLLSRFSEEMRGMPHC